MNSEFHSLTTLSEQHKLDIIFSHCIACLHSRCNAVCTYQDMPLPDIDSMGQCQTFVKAAQPLERLAA